MQAGVTIYVRGGTYSLTATITMGKSGTENARISLLTYPGEKPVLDFSNQTLSTSNRGVVLTGSYWHKPLRTGLRFFWKQRRLLGYQETNHY